MGVGAGGTLGAMETRTKTSPKEEVAVAVQVRRRAGDKPASRGAALHFNDMMDDTSQF